LPLLQEALARTDVTSGLFVDYFAGSGVVSRLAKSLGFAVLANDWEPYAREINLAYIQCNRPPEFSGLGWSVHEVFEHLNQIAPIEGYVARHLCPRDDRDVDSTRERQFFTRANGRRIDAIRQQLGDWERDGRISELERAYVLAALLYAASYVSNTSGVFKGFHRGWGGATGTALYRILSDLRLSPPQTHDNDQENRVTALDAQSLAAQLASSGTTADLAYLDPPYNQHPYGSNYHVLNTIALGDQPPISQTIGPRDKSAIRTDWRSARRSAYNHRREACRALERLLETIVARYILLSYSTDGLIAVESLVEAACRRGDVKVLTGRYKRYRVSAQRYSPRGYTVEFVLVIDAQRPPRPERTEPIVDEILRADKGAGDGSGEDVRLGMTEDNEQTIMGGVR
jgi:adenine-specific DNA-methyltransferase